MNAMYIKQINLININKCDDIFNKIVGFQNTPLFRILNFGTYR
jgi:hypothetical protein